MKFEYLASANDESSPRDLLHLYRANAETLHIEPWYEAAVSENRLMDNIDSLFEVDAIDKGEDGKLYTTYQCWIDGHEGEYVLWAEVEKIEEAL